MSKPVSLERSLFVLDSLRCLPSFGGLASLGVQGSKNSGIASSDDLSTWLIAHDYVSDRAGATALVSELVAIGGLIEYGSGKLAQPVPRQTADTEYRSATSLASFYQHVGHIHARNFGLNTLLEPHRAAAIVPRRPLSEVFNDINTAFAKLCADVLLRDGHEVAYAKIPSHPIWPKLLVYESQLAVAFNDAPYTGTAPAPPTASASESYGEETVRKASLFNMYNLLIMHAKLIFGHPTTLAARSKFFDGAMYAMAGDGDATGARAINSVDLEHMVLRCKATPGSPAYGLRLAEKDPRMHAVLNCGARSCPAIRALLGGRRSESDGEQAEEEIADAMAAFIGENVRIGEGAGGPSVGNAPPKTVMLSRLFKWFRDDFTPGTTRDAALIAWVAAHGPKYMRDRLLAVMSNMSSAPNNAGWKVKFDKYDWADNGDWSTPRDDGLMFVYDASFQRQK